MSDLQTIQNHIDRAERAAVTLAQRTKTPEERALVFKDTYDLLLAASERLANMRRAEIRAMSAEGFTLAEIAGSQGLTRERVRQILTR